MKNIFFLFALVFSNLSLAQSSNVVNAYTHLQQEELEKAKEAIDKASIHEQTKAKAKTWKYRGDIYYRIFTSDNPKFQSLDENPAGVAFEAYKKTLLLDETKSYKGEIEGKLYIIQNFNLNQGVEEFNRENFETAHAKFVTSVEVAEYFGKIDSLAVFNCALSAERAGKTDLAISWYKKCILYEYRPAQCCGFIIFLLQKEGRNEEAWKQVSSCRIQYPKDQSLLIQELNYLLRNGDYAAAEKNLEQAISNDYRNEILHFSLGTTLQSQGKNKAAEMAFLKALEFNPNYFDANYNLGALYFNSGVDQNNAASEEMDQEKADARIEKALGLFRQGIPYLEKANSLNPNDVNSLQSLRVLYRRLGDTENFERIDALLNQK